MVDDLDSRYSNSGDSRHSWIFDDMSTREELVKVVDDACDVYIDACRDARVAKAAAKDALNAAIKVLDDYDKEKGK